MIARDEGARLIRAWEVRGEGARLMFCAKVNSWLAIPVHAL